MTNKNNRVTKWEPFHLYTVLESLVVFLLYGCFIGLTTPFLFLNINNLNISKEITNLILEPIGIRTPAILSYLSFLLIAVFSIFAERKKIDLKELWIVRYISLPMLRAGISAGTITIGMASGVGIGCLILSIYCESKDFSLTQEKA